MKYPWANIAILFLGGAELLTGYLALTNGSPQWVAALHVHRILGFGIVALLFWKGRNILSRLLVWRLVEAELAGLFSLPINAGTAVDCPWPGHRLEPHRTFLFRRHQWGKLAYIPVGGIDPGVGVAHSQAPVELPDPVLGRPAHGVKAGRVGNRRPGTLANGRNC